MQLSILSPTRIFVQKEPIKSVQITGTEGILEILPGHAAMMGELEPGIFSFESEKPSSEEKKITKGFLSYGFFEVKEEQIKILADYVEQAQEIDLKRAQEAQKRAQDFLNRRTLDQKTFQKYQWKLRRAILRQKTITLL